MPTYVRTLTGFAPPAREDGIPFTTALIQEAASEAGPFTTIETITLDPVDTNPAAPTSRDFTTGLATLDPAGWYRIQWQDVSGHAFNSDPAYFPSPAGAYTTVGALRSELGLDDTQLSDAQATKLCEDASDLIDELLGARPVDETTGRKVVESDEEAWRWIKLTRAALKLAVRLHSQPKLTEMLWRKVRGPDFWFEDPSGSEFGQDVEALLNQSGFRRLTTTVSGKPGHPPWHGFAYNVESS